MKIRRTLEKRMKEMVVSGRGHFYEDAADGEVIFSSNIEGGTIDIYIDSFSLHVGEDIRVIKFSHVISITSHLKVEMFSGSSGSGSLDFYVPLDVACDLYELSLSVPFLAYSNIMNILIGLKEEWGNGSL